MNYPIIQNKRNPGILTPTLLRILMSTHRECATCISLMRFVWMRTTNPINITDFMPRQPTTRKWLFPMISSAHAVVII